MEKKCIRYFESAWRNVRRRKRARALANDPDIILADEPTGNLDSSNERNVLERLKELAGHGKIVIVVTHNEIVKDYADEDG